MARYLLIESRSPWESAQVASFYELARELAGSGHETTLFLVQNGVMPAREGAQDTGLLRIAGRVRVLADEFSLRERAMAPDRLLKGVDPAGIETVVDALAGGARVLWH
jgi:predicted peroxiredoxin